MPALTLVRDVLGVAVIVDGTHVFDAWTHNNVIVVLAVRVVFAAVIAGYFLSYWRSMWWTWLSRSATFRATPARL